MQTTLHETIVRDVLDFLDDIQNSDVLDHAFKIKANNFKSISSKTEGLTLVFPIITSTNVDITTASMIAKAQERQAVSMLQLLFSAVNLADAENGFEFIKQFHTNLNTKELTIDNFIDAMDAIGANESVCIENREMIQNIKNDLRNLNFYFTEDLSESSLNDFKVIRGYGSELGVIKEAPRTVPFNPNDNTIRNTIYAPNRNDYDSEEKFAKATMDYDRYMRDYQLRQDQLNQSKEQLNQSEDQFNRNMTMKEKEAEQRRRENAAKYNLDRRKYELDAREQERKADRDDFNDRRDIITKRLIDNDVKKANELVPTLMYVNFNQKVVGPNGQITAIPQQMIIGVKAKIYAVDSSEIIKRIIIKNQDNNGLLKLIRATTREISFVRDFLFAIDKAKIDAMSHSRRGSSSKVFKVLERRANKSKFKRRIGANNDAAAISTIHITKEEVDLIKKTANIDIAKAPVIRKIMESYNLMSFVYTDEATESANFIYDTGDDFYETMSYNSLEREASDNSAKKVINLMTKMSR